ncbi:MAG TPA: hypothetical protein VLH61_12105 [Bacteroidales bacterium]|nr:hypothetical protein [Bacteroidales bacterium]
MNVFLLAILLVAIAILGIAIKMFLKPGENFTRVCGSKFDPKSGKAIACTCHSQIPEDCNNTEELPGQK